MADAPFSAGGPRRRLLRRGGTVPQRRPARIRGSCLEGDRPQPPQESMVVHRGAGARRRHADRAAAGRARSGRTPPLVERRHRQHPRRHRGPDPAGPGCAGAGRSRSARRGAGRGHRPVTGHRRQGRVLPMNMNHLLRIVPARLAIAAAFLSAGVAAAADWPDCRHYEGPPLVASFDPEAGTNVLWKSEEAGGISTPVIMGGRLFTLVRHRPGTPAEAEKVLCLDAATGRKLWENVFNVYLSDVPAERVGWSAVIADPTGGTVFAHGVCGVFTAIDAATGKTKWQRSLHEEFGFLSTYGGRTNIPVVFEDLVIASAVVTGWGDTARPAHRFLGMDKATGLVRWMNGTKELPEDTTYSTPSLAVLGGEAALVFGSSDGSVWNFQPRTGRAVWNFRLSRRGLNVAPLVDGDAVFITQAEENLDNTSMGSVTRFKGTGTGDITAAAAAWQRKGVMDGRSMPVVLGDRLYCVDDGAKVYAFDKATGEPVGKPAKLLGTIVRGSPLVAGGRLYVCSTSGWHVLEPTKEGLKVVNRLRLDEEDEVTASPIAWNGLVFLTTGARLYCIGEKVVAADGAGHIRAEAAAAATAGGAGEPAWVQLVPAEAQIAAGESLPLKVRLFDAGGRFVRESAAEFTTTAGGVSADGVYTAPASGHAAAIVTAKAGGLEGRARIRSMPPLPWRFDFEQIPLAADPKTGVVKGEPPLPWIGMRHRHVVRDIDGSKCLVKVTTIPKGTRSQGWIGPIGLHDYVIRADFRARETGVGKPGSPASAPAGGGTDADAFAKAFGNPAALEKARMPDMGLVAQRYTLDLMGASQQLQLRSWPPQVATHFSKTIPFAWEAGRWYTMKLEARARDGAAELRGKVWPRGEPEPAAWTIEAVHEGGNLQGSPGFFGNSKDSEVFIDDVSVEAAQ
ncbi:MAG: serine/threonine protein kinase [Planctomycetia bacterium]|nr:serine/threonine protein kinase [Planctomycetia bacterium]